MDSNFQYAGAVNLIVAHLVLGLLLWVSQGVPILRPTLCWREMELVFVALGAAKLGAAIGQHARQPDTVLVIERHHPVIEDLGRGDRGLAGSYTLGKATLTYVSMQVRR